MSSELSPQASPFTPEQRRKTLTIYGRKAVLEALSDHCIDCQTLHLASSNKHQGIMADIVSAANRRGLNLRQHSRESLARISKNGKQDQGVALDIHCPHFGTIDHIINSDDSRGQRLLALDGITNPQNVGMIIRSAVAGGMDGILYPKRGVAALGPLVIKASVGTVFRAPIIPCEHLLEPLKALICAGVEVVSLEGAAEHSLFDYRPRNTTIYVLGSETDGVSGAVSQIATQRLHIPMAGGVESLNVAVAASLIAFAPALSNHSSL